MLYIKGDIITSSTYYFCIGESVSEDIEKIKEIIEDFNVFKEEFVINQTICNVIQKSIFLWKDYLETVIENNENLYSIETNSYYWLSFDGLKFFFSMNPYDHIESEKTRIEKKYSF